MSCCENSFALEWGDTFSEVIEACKRIVSVKYRHLLSIKSIYLHCPHQLRGTGAHAPSTSNDNIFLAHLIGATQKCRALSSAREAESPTASL